MTPLSKAAAAVALVEGAGYSNNKAAVMVGLPRQTVDNIINGNAGWEERKNQSVLSGYWQAEKARLQHAMTELTKDALSQASKSIDKASFLQAVTGAGILIDKTRLLAGEPTSISASLTVQAVASLDKLAALLGQSLVDDSKTIDVLPDQTPTK